MFVGFSGTQSKWLSLRNKHLLDMNANWIFMVEKPYVLRSMKPKDEVYQNKDYNLQAYAITVLKINQHKSSFF